MSVRTDCEPAMNPGCFKHGNKGRVSTPLQDKLLAALRIDEQKVSGLVVITGHERRAVFQSLQKLRDAEMVHVAAWKKDFDRNGQLVAIWAIGCGEDAERPERNYEVVESHTPSPIPRPELHPWINLALTRPTISQEITDECT